MTSFVHGGQYTGKLRENDNGTPVGFNVYSKGELLWDFWKGGKDLGRMDKLAIEIFRKEFERIHILLTEGDRAIDCGGYDHIVSQSQQTNPI